MNMITNLVILRNVHFLPVFEDIWVRFAKKFFQNWHYRRGLVILANWQSGKEVGQEFGSIRLSLT